MRTPFQHIDDGRNDMARIAMIAGALPLARAEEIAISLKPFGAATKS